MSFLFYLKILQPASSQTHAATARREASRKEAPWLSALQVLSDTKKIKEEHRDVSGTVLTQMHFIWLMIFSLAAWTSVAISSKCSLVFIIWFPSPYEVCFITFLPRQRGVVQICWWVQRNALHVSSGRSWVNLSLSGTGSDIAGYFLHLAWSLICLCDSYRPPGLILYDWVSVTVCMLEHTRHSVIFKHAINCFF